MLNLSPSRAVDKIQQMLRDLLSRSFTVGWILDQMNESKRTLVDEIRKVSPNFFKQSTVVTTAVGVDTYDLPLDVPPDGVTGVEPLYASWRRSRYYVSFRERNTILAGVPHFSTFHDGRRLRIVLKPTPGSVETVTVWYQRSTVEMQYGLADAGAATSITLAVAPTGGRVYLENDYPVGARVMITAGAGVGQVRQITAYVASSRVATVDAAWATNPDNTSTYEILPDWVDDSLMDFLVLDAVCAGYAREEDDAGEWKERRGAKLRSILEQIKNLQRVYPYRMELDRDWNGPNRAALPRDVRVP